MPTTEPTPARSTKNGNVIKRHVSPTTSLTPLN